MLTEFPFSHIAQIGGREEIEKPKAEDLEIETAEVVRRILQEHLKIFIPFPSSVE